ncbi:FAD-dependent oxidoreductase [Psychrobacter sp. 28M-43]|uniref:FAD-dependent oxidoreductase n=1 Tax=Psychrobacter sp. 28M-43 TaxID=2772254 RepID=UPI00168CC4FC|nr:FAD-dependent oxidoreductase [Psychrobacter sp. 28M-43]QOD12016.1 FAD-dependent oxidoreductase [Psychrobacter sp. 28M-43]
MTKFSPKKTLLLAGAGHAHIGMLRRLSAARLKDADTIDADIHLISEQPQTIYSGMLPGWMAGHYQLHDISIDIKSLCVRAGVRFIQQSLVQVNAASNKVVTTGDKQTDFDYDVLSLNTGADTDMRWLRDHKDQNDYRSDSDDRDANTDVIAIRPLSTFITQWQRILKDAQSSEKYQLAIIGAGAAAIELVMAAQVALRNINRNHQVTLVCGENLLSGFNSSFRQRVIKQLHRHDITIIRERATDYRDGKLSTTHKSLPINAVIAATGVIGSAWTASTDLEIEGDGFIAVNDKQQSVSHPNVFAVGDVATRVDKYVAHSGVHSVHGGAVEADNLMAYLKESVMKSYQPKSRTLYLLSCGDKYAIGSWGNVNLQGRWVWHLKKYIDKRFIEADKD